MELFKVYLFKVSKKCGYKRKKQTILKDLNSLIRQLRHIGNNSLYQSIEHFTFTT